MVARPPDAIGLYDPRDEHDACGVGFVVDIKGAGRTTSSPKVCRSC
jgi:glutamate synthase domain-containing protein 1